MDDMQDITLDVDVAFNGGLRELLRYTSVYTAASVAAGFYAVLSTACSLPEVQGPTDFDTMLSVLYLTSRETPLAGLILYNCLVFVVALNVCSWLIALGFGELREDEFSVRGHAFSIYHRRLAHSPRPYSCLI